MRNLIEQNSEQRTISALGEALPASFTCLKSTHKILQASSFVIILVLLLVQGVLAQSLDSDPVFTGLSDETREALKQQCLPEQFSGGATAYRNCVIAEIERRQAPATSTGPRTRVPTRQATINTTIVASTMLDNLSFDDKYAIQQACAPNRNTDQQTNVTGYNRCIEQQIAELNQEPVPDLTTLSDNEQYAVQQACFPAQSTLGALAYRQCVNTELTSLAQHPPVNLVGLSSVEKNSIQLGCSPSSVRQSAIQYRLCVAESLEVILKEQRRSQQYTPTEKLAPQNQAQATVESDAPGVTIASLSSDNAQVASAASLSPAPESETTEIKALVEQKATATTPPAQQATLSASRVISRPQSPSVQITTIPEPSDAPAEATPTTGLEQPDQTKPAETATTPAIDSVGKDILADQESEKFDLVKTLQSLELSQYKQYLVYALPVVLGLLVWRLAIILLGQRNHRYDCGFEQNEPIDFDTIDLDTPSPAFRAEELDIPSKSAETKSAGNQHEQQVFGDGPQHPRSTPVSPRKQSTFGNWLQQQPTLMCKRYCTEFVLYWVSYGDGNFKPEMKEHLFNTEEELNDHDLIKKWVLQQDLNACVDALSYMRSNFSRVEFEQTLNLLFAVLIKSELTVVQNIFFRFYADAAGIGSKGLAKLYEEGFGRPLPSIPRPDDSRWWNQINEQSRSTEAYDDRGGDTGHDKGDPDRTRMLTQLNLPGNATDDAIRVAYERIAARYHPSKFSELGPKEKELAQRHFQRYTEVQHHLTGEPA